MSSYGKDSAQLEQEVEQQRQRIENRIGEIKDRLSPGQLVDELLSYSKDGGQHFAANLGQTVSNNPLPAALLGISLVWLMSGQGPRLAAPSPALQPTSQPRRSRSDYPYATISGGLRRVNHAADDAGKWYSEFEDTGGRRFKAESNELGHRAGEFVDDAGRKFGGFIDEAGHRLQDFQDEAGNRLDEAAGWASDTWHDLRHQVGDMLGSAQHQTDRASRVIVDTFQHQPLVAGALAFAAGAALGAALPHTEQEDKAVGQLADEVRGKAIDVASEVYEEGKTRVADLYEKGKDGAAKVYDETVKAVSEGVNGAPEVH